MAAVLGWFSPFFAWLGALFSHWQNWASGSGFGGLVLIALNLFEVKLSLPRKILLLLFCFTLAASFVAWKDEKDLAEKAKSDYDRSSPNLRCEMNTFMIPPAFLHDLKGQVVVTIFIGPDIVNTGSPSIARRFTLTIVSPEGGFMKGAPRPIPSTLSLGINDVRHNTRIVIPTNSLLLNKVNSPIPQGGEESGFLAFDLPELSPNVDADVEALMGSRIRLNFEDVDGKLSSCEFVVNKTSSQGMNFLPGMSMDPLFDWNKP